MISGEQLARLFDVPRSTVYRSVDRGLIRPNDVVGRTFCFNTAELPKILDGLSSVLSVQEHAKACRNLRLSGLDEDGQVATLRRLKWLYFCQ